MSEGRVRCGSLVRSTLSAWSRRSSSSIRQTFLSESREDAVAGQNIPNEGDRADIGGVARPLLVTILAPTNKTTYESYPPYRCT